MVYNVVMDKEPREHEVANLINPIPDVELSQRSLLSFSGRTHVSWCCLLTDSKLMETGQYISGSRGDIYVFCLY